MENKFSTVCRTASWQKKSNLFCSFVLLKKWNFATFTFVVPVFQQPSHSVHCICLSLSVCLSVSSTVSHTLQACLLLEVTAALWCASTLLPGAAAEQGHFPRCSRGGSCRAWVPAGHWDGSASPSPSWGASVPSDPCTEQLGALIYNPTCSCSFQAVHRLFSTSWVQCCQEHSPYIYQ